MPPADVSPVSAVLPHRGPLGAGSLDEIARRLGAVVQRSPADETEVVWMETLDGRAVDQDGPEPAENGPRADVRRSSSVQVRVRERGRVGLYRTGANSQAEVDTAVRQALGQARLNGPGPPLPLARPGAIRPLPGPLHDPAVALLDPATARDLLASGRRSGEHLTLDWHELRLVIANSRGLSRATQATSVTLTARHGTGAGAGWAAGSARSLAGLAAPRILERARQRAAEEGDEPNAAVLDPEMPLLLSPEAVAVLVQRMSDTSLSSLTFSDGRSWVSGRLDEAVFHPAFTLVDDGTDGAGLPFPFDWDGWPKRRVALIEAGVLRSPALDAQLADRLGSTPTPHAVGCDESRASHLFVAPGHATQAELRRVAAGGLAISALDEVRCNDPQRGLFRAVARGVRRISDTGDSPLAEAVADLVWQGSFASALASIAAAGEERVTLACPGTSGQGAWGAATAPALALAAVSGLSRLA